MLPVATLSSLHREVQVVVSPSHPSTMRLLCHALLVHVDANTTTAVMSKFPLSFHLLLHNSIM